MKINHKYGRGLRKMNVLWNFSVFVVLVDVYVVGVDEVSVKEGDSVTLPTDVTADQHETIKWFVNDTRIAEISTDVRCTDVQCNKGTERFRDRLELDPQTGSLTITNTRTTDSGLYFLEFISVGRHREKTFNVTVQGAPAAERGEIKGTSVKDVESGLSSAEVGGIVAGVLLFAAAVFGAVYYHKCHQRGQYRIRTRRDQNSEKGGLLGFGR
ncbi:uncharacterized protein LOC122327545 isoform X2 [Puntigrus tetrazona]|uniref:uncharacterized protein LOC122327545 isoform X2 n=1 Tax=Puntigrus tetrazona TaxID=1606681 RepID=UPI001C8A0164|nr:uncharacterized protein LOC122327545 isoform X2 [Puntigrus tetrazona]